MEKRWRKKFNFFSAVFGKTLENFFFSAVFGKTLEKKNLNFFFCCFWKKTVEKNNLNFFFCRSHLHHRTSASNEFSLITNVMLCYSYDQQPSQSQYYILAPLPNLHQSPLVTQGFPPAKKFLYITNQLHITKKGEVPYPEKITHTHTSILQFRSNNLKKPHTQ